jgi:hypothetical protein
MGTRVESEIHLVNKSIGDLFTIPEADWTVISERVGLALLARDVSSQIAAYLPDFPALITASDRWKNHTFPALIGESSALPPYCRSAKEDFSGLQQQLSAQDPYRPLSPELKAEAEVVLARLSQSSIPRARAFQDLVGELMVFASVNQLIDEKIRSYTDRLGPEWRSIEPSVGKVSRASALVLGAWAAISSDLSFVVSGSIPITTTLLFSLGLSSALLAWTNISREAEAFLPIAHGQEKYLSGQWLQSANRARDEGRV